MDAGNVFGGGEEEKGESARQRAEVMIEGMSLMNYDALNLGVNEFGFGRPFLDELQREAEFPFLSANLVARNSPEPAYTPYVIEEAGLLRVGIIGLMSPALWSAGGEGSLQPHEPAAVLDNLLPQVRKKAAIVVVLAHLPLEEAVELLNNVQGVTVMVVAHGGEPTLSSSMQEVNGALLVSTDQCGTVVGKLQIVADIDGRILDYQAEAMTLDEYVGQDARLVDLLEQAGRP